jgi:hypothetical protein
LLKVDNPTQWRLAISRSVNSLWWKRASNRCRLLESIADDQIQILKNTCGRDFITWREKLNVASQPDTMHNPTS